MRQTIADPNSNEEPEWKIYDPFDVTIKYECYDDALTLTGSTTPNDIAMREY
jgi:hypothetical protein